MRKLGFLFAALVFLGGCSVPWQRSPKHVEVWPVLPTPEKIVLALPADDEAIKKDDLIDSLYRTIEYAKRLEMTIEIYNESAKAHNAQARENLGLNP